MTDLQITYGVKFVRPDLAVTLVSTPLTRKQRFIFALRDTYEFAVPLLLFAIGWTLMTIPFWWPQ
jgi:hypothetical protein